MLSNQYLKSISDTNAEINVIGSLINGDGDIEKVEVLDFSKRAFRLIYEAIGFLKDSGAENITPAVIYDTIVSDEKNKAFFEKDGMEIIRNAAYVTDGNFDYNLNIVRKFSLLRKYASKGFNVSEYCDPDDIDFDRTVERNNKFKNTSLQELKMHFENIVTTINDEITGLEYDPFIGYEPIKIPGIEKELKWLVDGMFYTGTFQIISAKAKGGKSQLAYQLATCLNNGVDFLGHKVLKSKCLYIDCELSPNEIFRRTELCNKHLLIEKPNDLKIINLKRTPYGLDEIINGVKKCLKSNPDIDVIFFDNFYSFFDGNINDSTEVRKVLNKLSNVSETATIFLICHNNKATGQQGGTDNAIYAASGSNAFAGYADEFISIEEKEGGKAKIVHVDGRHVTHVAIPCLYNSGTDYFFDLVYDKDQAKIILEEGHSSKILGRSEEYLKATYPDLYEYIANEDNIRTTNAICKVFPGETKDSLKEKGFWLSNSNKENNRVGIKTLNWYVRDTR